MLSSNSDEGTTAAAAGRPTARAITDEVSNVINLGQSQLYFEGIIVHTMPAIHMFRCDEIYPWITRETVNLNKREIPQMPSDYVHIESQGGDPPLVDLTATDEPMVIEYSEQWGELDHQVQQFVEFSRKNYKSARKNPLITDAHTFAQQCKFAGECLRKSGELLYNSGVKLLDLIAKEKSVGTREVANPLRRKFVCTLCRREHDLKENMQQCYSACRKRKLVCNICQKQCESDENLRQHVAAHVSGPVLCPICGEVFTNENERNACIRKHQKNVNRDKSDWYTCEQCYKQYNNKESYTNHVLTHSEERKYPCPHCTKKFKNPGAKRQHVFKQHKDKK